MVHRHPLDTGIILLTTAMQVKWPSVVTIIMWAVLIWTYYVLARREEREAEAAFGAAYLRCR